MQPSKRPYSIQSTSNVTMCASGRVVCWHLLVLLLLCASTTAHRTAQKKQHEYEGYTVHLVFSNHLDVGFTDLDSKVVDAYFHKHLPRAAQLAQEVHASPNNTHGDTFKYLTHSWLLSLFLDCPPNMGWACPNKTEVDTVTDAIAAGAITWHAMPFNPQYEVFDSSLLRFAVQLTHSIDDHFKQPHKRMASLRDVPGLTRAAVPILASQGVKALTSGVNGFSAPPGVPKATPFIWLDEQTGSQLIYMVHPGGYAGLRKDGLHIDSHRDCVSAPGLRQVLCASWGDDNFGPPANASQVLAMFDYVRSQWPGAAVVGSSLEAYLDGLLQEVQSGGVNLPVVTGEIGDTWIHGIASDPARMSDYRAVLRARRDCEASAHCDSKSGAFFNFSRLLIKIPEHTWGISFNQFFGDFTNYSNTWLHQHLQEGEDAHPGLAVSVESWRRQRRYIDWALQALPDSHPIVTAVTADRAARQAAASVSTEALAAAGARKLLQQPQEPADGGACGDAGVEGGGDEGSSTSSSDNGVAAVVGRCARLLEAESTGVSAVDGQQQQLFCSKHWLLQVDRHTGGLTRLQRVYGEGDAAQLGNDWASGSTRHTCDCSHKLSKAAVTHWASGSRLSQWLQQLQDWWQQHGLQWLQQLAAWLPSPEAGAAAADFALGDEAVHFGPTAQPQQPRAPPYQQHTNQLQQQQQLQKRKQQEGSPWAQGAGAAAAAADPVALYRKLLSVSTSPDNPSRSAGVAAPPTATTATAAGRKGHSCSCGRHSHSSSFAELQYNVYSLQDYDPVWEHYAYQYPVWIGDFGKNNLSASSNLSEVARPRLVQAYDLSSDSAGLKLHLELSFPHKLVKHAGAPAKAWMLLEAPNDSAHLVVTFVWQDKTPTRLPEALWLRFKPGQGAVAEDTWRMHKLDGALSASELVLNGSHSLHGISTGVSVRSASGREELQIGSVDVPLVNLGAPNPLPNPCQGPDMMEGVSFNPVNNIWGTNYAMWVPFVPQDANLAFRFTLDARAVDEQAVETGDVQV